MKIAPIIAGWQYRRYRKDGEWLWQRPAFLWKLVHHFAFWFTTHSPWCRL